MTMETLPALDLTFHPPRNYSTTGMVKGKRVIIYVASCKQEGCGESLRHLNRAGRSRLVWQHRRDKILQVRRDFFGGLHGFTSVELGAEMTRLADCSTHSFLEWMAAVDEVLDEIAEVNHKDLPDTRWQIWWDIGWSARDAANNAIDKANAA